MQIVGRHTLARILGPLGVSERYVVSRPRAQWPASIRRYHTEDWRWVKDVGWQPTIAGGAGFSSTLQYPGCRLGFGTLNTPSQTTLALSSNYVYNTSGAAIGARMVNVPTTKTITSAYVNITSFTGNAANVADLNYELRNVASSLPGGTLNASGTLNPASTTGWLALTGLSFAMTQDVGAFSVWGDANGGGVDFANVLRNISIDDAVSSILMPRTGQTTTGWSAGNTFNASCASIVHGFSDSTAWGSPFSTSAASANTTEQRGLYVSNGFTEQIKFLGITGAVTQSNNISGINLWEGATGPSGTPTATGAVDLVDAGATTTITGYLLATPYTCAKATAERFVYTYSVANTTVRKLQIGTGADAVLKSAMFGGSAMYWGQANGTTNWNNDDTAAWPALGVIIEDQIAVTGGGGTTTSGKIPVITSIY